MIVLEQIESVKVSLIKIPSIRVKELRFRSNLVYSVVESKLSMREKDETNAKSFIIEQIREVYGFVGLKMLQFMSIDEE